MKLRKDILPVIEPPNWDKGYLSVEVELRAMISNDVTRLAEIPEMREKLNSLDDGTPGRTVNVTLMVVASGFDSTTGFAHYAHKGLLGNDDSLLTEHMMSLTLVADGEDLWVNANPQSDVFCHATDHSTVWSSAAENQRELHPTALSMGKPPTRLFSTATRKLFLYMAVSRMQSIIR